MKPRFHIKITFLMSTRFNLAAKGAGLFSQKTVEQVLKMMVQKYASRITLPVRACFRILLSKAPPPSFVNSRRTYVR